MHARFQEHVYAPHTHDAYSFGVTDAGAQQFRCRGALHTSAAGMVMALNPDEVHDGRKAAELGYHYRIVHIHPRVVRAVLADAAGRPTGMFDAFDAFEAADGEDVDVDEFDYMAIDGDAGAPLPLFARPVLGDRRLADAIARLHAALSGTAGALARDERLRAVILGAAARGATRPPALRTLADAAQRGAARRARALMREAYPAQVPVASLAQAAGCSRFALYRAFSAEFGMSPSDYERQLRLRHARGLLKAGGNPADVAAATGFADQAHLTRWFKRAYGITPGVYAGAARESALPLPRA